MKIKIGHVFYDYKELEKVVFKKEVINGLIELNKLEISIRKSLKGTQKYRVIIHEILHGIADSYNIVLSEKNTDMLAIGITGFLIDNPKFIKGLAKNFDNLFCEKTR